MRRVLRLRLGERVIAFDGQGNEFTVNLTTLRDEQASGTIESQTSLSTDPSMRLTLYQALLPRDRFELVLQKATEVGVSTFVPLSTERSLVPAGALDAARLQRWQRIVEEAAEQSGRGGVPGVESPLSLRDALKAVQGTPAILAWERESERSLRQALGGLHARGELAELALFVGPEGGFSGAEVEAARATGVTTVSLGPRILRSESAAPVLAAVVLYELGELEPRR
jgi:16S rRNA (uracil1498-N3)-methyltransferase